MNIMEEIFEIKSCIEILVNNRRNFSTVNKNDKVFILGDLHPSRGKSGLDIALYSAIR